MSWPYWTFLTVCSLAFCVGGGVSFIFFLDKKEKGLLFSFLIASSLTCLWWILGLRDLFEPSKINLIRSILISLAWTPLGLGLGTYINFYACRHDDGIAIDGKPVAASLRWFTYLGIALLVIGFYLPQIPSLPGKTVGFFKSEYNQHLSVPVQSTVAFFKQTFHKETVNQNAGGDVGSVELPEKANIGVKKFLRIFANYDLLRGGGGVILNGKPYPNGTVFDVVENDNETVTILLEGEEKAFPMEKFHGGYGSAGQLLSLRWDYANNHPTGLDTDEEYLKRYYHSITVFINRHWVIALIFFAFTVGIFFLMDETEKVKYWLAVTALFVLISTYMGNTYETFLAKYELVSFANKIWLPDIGLDYKFCRIFHVPLFLIVHIGLLYTAFLLFTLLHYLIVPHPAEQHFKKMRQGTMSESEGKEKMEEAMYDYKKEGLLHLWVTKNRLRRLKAVLGLVQAEKSFLEALFQNIKIKRKFK